MSYLYMRNLDLKDCIPISFFAQNFGS